MHPLVLLSLLLVSAGPAAAVTVANAPPPPVTQQAAPPAAASTTRFATRASDDSSGVRKGVVQSVDRAKASFQVHGQTIAFAPQQVRVVARDGKQTSIHALQPGTQVRFTLDPTDPKRRRADVIYLE